jgi:hypothetical protein
MWASICQPASAGSASAAHATAEFTRTRRIAVPALIDAEPPAWERGAAAFPGPPRWRDDSLEGLRCAERGGSPRNTGHRRRPAPDAWRSRPSGAGGRRETGQGLAPSHWDPFCAVPWRTSSPPRSECGVRRAQRLSAWGRSGPDPGARPADSCHRVARRAWVDIVQTRRTPPRRGQKPPKPMPGMRPLHRVSTPSAGSPRRCRAEPTRTSRLFSSDESMLSGQVSN